MKKLTISLLAAVLCALFGNAAHAAPALEPIATYLTIESGELPVVLSVPHGGDGLVDGVATRTAGTTMRDDHVNELAATIQRQLVAQTGKRTYLVGAKVSRKFVDFNRDVAKAYEDPAVQPIYDAYYAALWQDVAALRDKPGAVLFDIHGQNAVRDAILRGTKDGLTADNSVFYTQPDGFFTRVQAAGIKVVPAFVNDEENRSFNGGNIVRTFGRNVPEGSTVCNCSLAQTGAPRQSDWTALRRRWPTRWWLGCAPARRCKPVRTFCVTPV
ncbi:hypothetical protein GJ699_06140 [Duganella sp. FT80W]|uniref:N-formylglutamate amidohydrolase n=1 Tax=Duganella guangzhouensis TaxID=2666084 RepID=A0A6I2KUK1_9BURK|nr:N-formylglutamate amidohydrolase [Duganella guangzhouensis]MRW89558.1 hypothetical protein [Duganella guangzhouensis]